MKDTQASNKELIKSRVKATDNIVKEYLKSPSEYYKPAISSEEIFEGELGYHEGALGHYIGEFKSAFNPIFAGYKNAIEEYRLMADDILGIKSFYKTQEDGTQVLIRDAREQKLSLNPPIHHYNYAQSILNIARTVEHVYENHPIAGHDLQPARNQIRQQAIAYISKLENANTEKEFIQISKEFNAKAAKMMHKTYQNSGVLEIKDPQHAVKVINVAKDMSNFDDIHADVVTITQTLGQTFVETNYVMPSVSEKNKEKLTEVKQENLSLSHWSHNLSEDKTTNTVLAKMIKQNLDNITDNQHVIPNQLRMLPYTVKNFFKSIVSVYENDKLTPISEVLRHGSPTTTNKAAQKEDGYVRKLMDFIAQVTNNKVFYTTLVSGITPRVDTDESEMSKTFIGQGIDTEHAPTNFYRDANQHKNRALKLRLHGLTYNDEYIGDLLEKASQLNKAWLENNNQFTNLQNNKSRSPLLKFFDTIKYALGFGEAEFYKDRFETLRACRKDISDYADNTNNNLSPEQEKFVSDYGKNASIAELATAYFDDIYDYQGQKFKLKAIEKQLESKELSSDQKQILEIAKQAHKVDEEIKSQQGFFTKIFNTFFQKNNSAIKLSRQEKRLELMIEDYMAMEIPKTANAEVQEMRRLFPTITRSLSCKSGKDRTGAQVAAQEIEAEIYHLEKSIDSSIEPYDLIKMTQSKFIPAIDSLTQEEKENLEASLPTTYRNQEDAINQFIEDTLILSASKYTDPQEQKRAAITFAVELNTALSNKHQFIAGYVGGTIGAQGIKDREGILYANDYISPALGKFILSVYRLKSCDLNKVKVDQREMEKVDQTEMKKVDPQYTVTPEQYKKLEKILGEEIKSQVERINEKKRQGPSASGLNHSQ